ncbi:MAG: hypothetical protein Q6366_002375 [Candidatus Freyarchaeota archaeon]
MYVLEILDKWATLQERMEGKKSDKNKHVKVFEEIESPGKLIRRREFPRKTT